MSVSNVRSLATDDAVLVDLEWSEMESGKYVIAGAGNVMLGGAEWGVRSGCSACSAGGVAWSFGLVDNDGAESKKSDDDEGGERRSGEVCS